MNYYTILCHVIRNIPDFGMVSNVPEDAKMKPKTCWSSLFEDN